MKSTPGLTLGLDIGALAIKAATKNTNGETSSIYRLHKGYPDKTIRQIVDELGAEFSAVAITGGGGRRIAESLGIVFVDPAVALIAALDEDVKIRHLIDIGGGSLSIVDLDEDRRFSGFRTNSLCAAGTGSFLDEQAIRMGLSLDEMCKEHTTLEPPRIAARCAVFAKSDLIHRQQEGYSIPEMWSGLCRGMVTTALSTLFKGHKPLGPVLLAGGVALNREVVRWLKNSIDVPLILPGDPSTFSARGAIKAARSHTTINWDALSSCGEKQVPRRAPLTLMLSNYPSFECRKNYADDDTEVRIHLGFAGDVVIGFDIGSTSTKAAIVNMEGQVAADLYRRTSGDPISAVKKIIAAIGRIGSDINVKGVGTTGSGRKMVGSIIGADRIVNEITAHVKGAVATDPDVETIFEIGGQDAKFISLKNGQAHDSNMNYVCAAGTGSFVEEQAGRLGFALTEIGDSVRDIAPPFSSDRCTVFMEQDVHSLIRQGFERREVMGSVLYSVVQNYLNRVVGRRLYSRRKILFMGATARNRGLVAAFERLLDTKIVVSPFCHVMGAFGVARIVLDEVAKKGESSRFRGLGFADTHVELKRDVCTLCPNDCRITRALIGKNEDEKNEPSWGYMCGRDPDEKRLRVNPNFEPFRKRASLWRKFTGTSKNLQDAPVIGIPSALLGATYLPLWVRFFAELGIEVLASKPTDETTLPSAADFIGSEYCYPVKIAHGHVWELAHHPKVNSIFLPYMVQGEEHDDNFKRSVFCPYNIALPSIIKTSRVAGEKDIITAIINMQLDTGKIAKELQTALSPILKTSVDKIKRAWAVAVQAKEEFHKNCETIGKDFLKLIEDSGQNGVVILGRPYNVYDTGSNLNIPQKIADLGLFTLTVDMLPLKDVKIDPIFNNMYWRYGRKILQAATLVASHPKLFAVYLTNFACGPDSFLQTYVEKILRGKPLLMLELDEHSADAGYVTRLEAFRDVIKGFNKTEAATAPVKNEAAPVRTLWIPPMHPYGTPLLAAAFRNLGRPARPLLIENIETFELAKRYCRGTECVPLPSTIGAFLNVLKKSDAPERECFFMPSAKGPCRFGQYHTLHRLMLDEAGYPNTPIEAWSDESGSYGNNGRASRKFYNAMLSADLLFKTRCRLRPYAVNRDEFDQIIKQELAKTILVIEAGQDLKRSLRNTCDVLSKIERRNKPKPLVGIVGEIYVRLNPFANGRLVETIEDAGGEAWVAPMTEWFHYLAFLDTHLAKEDGKKLRERLGNSVKNAYMMHQEKSLMRCMSALIGDRAEPPMANILDKAQEFLPKRFEGESILTIGRAIEFAQNGANLIINCAPFNCMPGTLTAGMMQSIEKKMGVPVVSLFFDGETDLTHLVRTYLANLTAGRQLKRDHI